MNAHPPEPRPAPTGYVHDALLFDDDRFLVEATAAFLAGAIASGELVTLACTDEHNRLLLEAVGEADCIRVLPRSSVYRHAPAAIERYRRVAQQALADGFSGIRAIGEVPFGFDLASHREWGRFEAVCNPALAELPLWSTCVYDRRALPADALGTARATHPTLRVDGRRDPNPDYLPAADYLARVADPAVMPVETTEATVTLTVAGEDDLSLLREALRRVLTGRLRLATAGTDEAWDGLEQQVLAVHEIADNAVRHGRSPALVRLWVMDDQLTVTVTDAGGGLDDPFAGWIRRGPATGLWLARQLCHELDLRHDDDGFTVRLRSSLPG